MEYRTMIEAAAKHIRDRIGVLPETALMLGSGLGDLAREVVGSTSIPYSAIPHFPVSTAPGHAGLMTVGALGGKSVLVMGGRFHYYEGYDTATIAFPIRVLQQLGVRTLVLTNAAGGINLSYAPGDLMIISDHINMTGQNPLRGTNDDTIGPRFPDMSHVYDTGLRDLALTIAKERGVPCRIGVYAWMTGPSFETPAEIRMLRILGADAVGMSTVPEAITARHCGIKVVGISCISNMASGVLDKPVTEAEVFEITKRVKDGFSALVRGLVERIEN